MELKHGQIDHQESKVTVQQVPEESQGSADESS